nr:RNA-directed DNA polymerase, eukaryota, reverse transcriptase zinc-binding domain protein [Tanacetum cinerariifolium]
MLGKVSRLGLGKMISRFTLDEAQDDKWEWALTSSRKFIVTSLCRAINLRLNANDISAPPFSWNSWVRCKVNVCAWRVALNWLLTKFNLYERGINLHALGSKTPLILRLKRSHVDRTKGNDLK